MKQYAGMDKTTLDCEKNILHNIIYEVALESLDMAEYNKIIIIRLLNEEIKRINLELYK